MRYNYYSPDALALPTHSLFVYLLPSVLELSFIQKHFPQIHPLYFLTLFLFVSYRIYNARALSANPSIAFLYKEHHSTFFHNDVSVCLLVSEPRLREAKKRKGKKTKS